MMSLCYTQRDAERWAAFSGDYNPIHFDAAEAKRLGLEGVCVHGMRALLDVKSGLSQAMAKRTLSSGGLLFSSRLRAPVVCGMPYRLELSEAGSQIGGKLCSVDAQSTHISSKLGESKPLILTPATQANTLRGEALAALYDQFLAVESEPAPLWSFYDAVLFRQLVNAPETLETVRGIIPEHQPDSLGDVFSLVQVVQTHHETRFSPQLLRLAGDGSTLDALHFSILPTLVMGEKASGLVLVAAIEAWRVNEPLISVTVTLRTGPLVK